MRESNDSEFYCKNHLVRWPPTHFWWQFPPHSPKPASPSDCCTFFCCKSRLRDQEQTHYRITHLFVRRQSPFQNDLILKKMVVNVPNVKPIPLLVLAPLISRIYETRLIGSELGNYFVSYGHVCTMFLSVEPKL